MNQILPRISAADFRRTAGNEIAFHVFDYPPQSELEVRAYLKILRVQAQRQTPNFNLLEINLFEFVIDYLKSRRLLAPALALGKQKGAAKLRQSLSAPLDEEKRLAPLVAEAITTAAPDVTLLTGIGNAYPLARVHTLLNNLHPLVGDKTIIVFYPGEYNNQFFNLFNSSNEKNYYRAFRLIP